MNPPAPRPMRARAFTLPEIMVVVAVVAIVGAIVITALVSVIKTSRHASCANNLSQFGKGIKAYFDEQGYQYPMWLSSLDFGPGGVYVCPSDDSKGAEGGVPDELSSVYQSQYAETNDLAGLTQADLDSLGGSDTRRTLAYRDASVSACSYLYEWTGEDCSWSSGQTWREAKTEEKNANLAMGTDIYKFWDNDKWAYGVRDTPTVPSGPAVPLARCFWHQPIINEEDGEKIHDPYEASVLTLRVDFSEVDLSPPRFWWIRK